MNLNQVDFSYNIPPEDFEEIPIISEILPNLYMGMSPYNYLEFDVIINLEPVVHSYLWNSINGKMFIHFPMYDTDDFELDGVDIAPIAMLALGQANNDRKVLVHCSAGLNRSGLIVAFACWLAGIDNPVEFIRQKRDPWALCNKTFESWINDNCNNNFQA